MPQNYLQRPGAMPWAPPQWNMFAPQNRPQIIPVPVPVPVPAEAFSRPNKLNRNASQRPAARGPSLRTDPRVAQMAQGQPNAFSYPVPQQRPQGPVSAPAGGGGVDWAQLASQAGRGLAAPFDAVGALARSPQQPDEMRANYLARQAFTLPVNASVAAGNQMLTGAKAVGREVGNAFNYMAATPNSDMKRAFDALIVRQESNGRQVDAQGNPLVGRDRNGQVPSAARGGAAIGVSQIQEATARETAQKHGLQWSPDAWKNNRDYNYQLGLLHFQDRVEARGGNVLQAAADYHSGPKNVNRAIAEHGPEAFAAGLGPEGQNYVSTVMQRMGGLASTFGAPPPAFDTGPYKYAANLEGKAAQLEATPFSASFTQAALPDRPKPQEMAAPDFSAGNAAFEATRPKNPFDDPKEQVRVKRQQYFKGIGQAMASLSGGEGIGTMLMKMGAGALVGRARGEEMIDDREAEFEKSMQEYNRALASRDDSQAIAAANVMNSNIQQRNQFAEAVWQDNVKQIEKFQPNVVGNNLITYTKDPADPNKYTMTSTPIGFGIQANSLRTQANIGLQMGTAMAQHGQWAYQSQQTSARTALGLATQYAAQQGNPQASVEGYLTEAAGRAEATVKAGTWRQLFGKDTDGLAQGLDEGAKQAAAQATGLPPGAPPQMLQGPQAQAYQDAYNNFLSSSIYEMAVKAGTTHKLFSMDVAQSAYYTQRARNTTQRQSTNAKGQRTFSQSWDTGE